MQKGKEAIASLFLLPASMLKSSLLHTWLEECAQIHFFWREVHGVFQPFDVRLGQMAGIIEPLC